jgi:hypothetical protein
MDTEIISNIRSTVRLRLRNRAKELGVPTKDEVVSIIDSIIARMREDNSTLVISDDIKEAAIAAVLHENTVKNDEYSFLKGEDTAHVDWLTAARSNINWHLWDRYRQFLLDKSGMPSEVVGMIGRVSDQIMDCLENPARLGQWSTRGLVVGSVQSGKTANYAALINKALDAGYKFIVVVAGVHDTLRNQTQLRIDQTVTGMDSRGAGTIDRYGVSAFGPGIKVHSLTSTEADFNANTLSGAVFSLGGDPVIVVVKKHATILENLSKWARANSGTTRADGVSLEPFGGKDPQASDNFGKRVDRCPMLLIDDEADHASINTASGEDMTAINHQLVNLLGSFERAAYVGYTATPYANLFSDDTSSTNLFPRNFIINIEPPDNYVGPSKVFGLDDDVESGIQAEESLGIVRELRQQDYIRQIPEKHKTEFRPTEIPGKMREAIHAFIIASAVRVVRGRRRNFSKHNSMLIHVSRFTKVIDKFVLLVTAEVDALRRSLETGSPAVVESMKKLWETDFVPTAEKVPDYYDIPEVTWDDVADELVHCIRKTCVRAIHGSSTDILDYDRQDDGLFVVAIGGDKLSRGLTLEALTVSFFLRTSKMYDTLMQMGRWFGYKDGYVDVCRVYTSGQLVSWYKHIALADTELRREFLKMARLRKTPLQYGLKVRTHPQGLRITSLSKMRHSTRRQLTFANQLIQSTVLNSEADVTKGNFEQFEKFVVLLDSVRPGRKEGSHLVFDDVSKAKIIDFIENLQLPSGANVFAKQPFLDFLQAQDRYASNWTVSVAGMSGGRTEGICYRLLGSQRHALIRSVERTEDDKTLVEKLPSPVFSPRKHNLLDPKDQGIDLRSIILDQILADELLEKSELLDLKPRIGELIGKNLYEVAFELTKLTRPRKEGLPVFTRPNGEDFRLVRPDNKALLLIYPFTPALGDDETGTVVAPLPHPVIGIAASFASSESVKLLEYQFNQVFQKLFGVTDVDDGFDN